MVFDRQPDLGLCIGGRMKPGGKRQIRPGAPRKFRIDDEGQDRVEKRGGCQFDLASFLKRFVHRDNLPDGRLLQGQDFLFVLFREPAIFRAQVRQAGKALQAAISEPCEVMPYL